MGMYVRKYVKMYLKSGHFITCRNRNSFVFFQAPSLSLLCSHADNDWILLFPAALPLYTVKPNPEIHGRGVDSKAGLQEPQEPSKEGGGQLHRPPRLLPSWFSCPPGGPPASPAGLGAEAEAGLHRPLGADEP